MMFLVLLLTLADTPAADDALVGMWASETRFPPALHGELTVRREKGLWRATIAGAEALSDIEPRFTFDGKRGQFRGKVSADGKTINGFWVQPAGPDAGQQYASPVVLARAGREVWRGSIEPMVETFTLYLSVFRNADGVLVGAFRNPEYGAHGGPMQFRVTREGDAVHFTVKRENGTEMRRSGTLLTSPDRLQIFWSQINRSVELTRRTPEQAAGFFPRPPGEPKYVYRKPPATGDGWTTARAADTGMNEEALAKLVQRLIESDPTSRRPTLMHSLLIAHRGKLVLEEYFYGFDREKPHDTRSAGKTFSSIMLGAAMRARVPIAPETKLYELVAHKGPFANPDPRKAKITLAHVMTHTTGLACDDNNEESPGLEDRMQAQTEQPDWWKYTLDLPMVQEPGVRYAYCSGTMNLMGAALTTATKTWLPELFERTVAAPLSFGPHYWNLIPTGEGYLGGGAYLRPRDLLKVGQVFLDDGVWQGKRIVDKAWVAQSTAPRMDINPATTGVDPKEFGEYYAEATDAYAWHLTVMKVGEKTYRGYQASGNGGQLLIVIPELDLTVVFNGANYGMGGIWGRWSGEIVPQEIIPAIR